MVQSERFGTHAFSGVRRVVNKFSPREKLAILIGLAIVSWVPVLAVLIWLTQ